MKTRSTSASHSLEGWGTKSTTVKWSICMHMRQHGLLKCHRGIFCELFTFTTCICRLFSGAK